MAARSKAYARGHWTAKIVDSSLAGDMVVSVFCFVLPRRGLCDELIAHPEESYRL